MKTQAITASLILLGVAVLFTPRPREDAVVATPAAIGPQDTDLRVRESRGSSGQARLTRHADGHFYADIRIDGRPVRMLVDTGASFVALTRADADRAGVDWREDDAVVVGNGAGGPVRGVPVTLDQVELGGHRARAVQAAVIVDGLQVSLLGQSFLQQVDTVRIEGDRMTLGSE